MVYISILFAAFAVLEISNARTESGDKTMTGFGEMIFQNGMKQGLEQGEKSIVEYMMKTGKYSLEEISAITGVSMETVEKISAGQVYGAEPRD